MLVVTETALALIGTTGPVEFPEPIEHLPLDQVLKLEDETKAVDPTPLDGYAEEDPAVTAADPFIPADRVHFPEGRRLNLTRIDAQLTSEDGSSHVLSLGEFAALYLSVEPGGVWGEEVPLAKFAPNATAPTQVQPLRWDHGAPAVRRGLAGRRFAKQGAIVMPPISFPERVAGHLYVVPRETAGAAEGASSIRRSCGARSSRMIKEFHRTCRTCSARWPTCRRMMLDDHDVTDDYFLNPVWRTALLGRKLGQAIIGSAMIAYALFQDWGNDPAAYGGGPKAQPSRSPSSSSSHPEEGTGSAGIPADRRPARSRSAAHRDAGRQIRLGQPATQMALHNRRPQAPRDRVRQSYATQLRHPSRPAG
jgi:hypothetical protein